MLLLLLLLFTLRFVVQEFFQYYMESNGSSLTGEEENRMDLLKKGRF